ncbi:SSD1 protein [Auriculariales sp. MPI-PUGE-AT-0066]|nr:SSD1 protein [Auriculariales sp. MPI-PUGE-AT-0066]
MTDDPQKRQPPPVTSPSPGPGAGTGAKGGNQSRRTQSNVSRPGAGGATPLAGNNGGGGYKKVGGGGGGPGPGSGTDTRSNSGDGKKSQGGQRTRNPSQSGQPAQGTRSTTPGAGQAGHRKGQSTASAGARPQKDSPKGTPVPGGQSDAMTSLQRVIGDLKAMPQNTQQPAAAIPIPQGAVNAPPFQPGAQNDVPPRHRKAQSLGSSHGQSGAYTTPRGYAPNLGSMNEDTEPASAIYDEGEIPDSFQQFPGQQGAGSTGRPQLAPSFQFGRKPSLTGRIVPVPAISEEDVGFQFPQQQKGDASGHQLGHRKTGSEINGIMAEQIALQSQIEALQQQQQALLQQQIASSQIMASVNTPQLASNARQAAHRRIQSTQVPMGMGMGMGFAGAGNFNPGLLAFPSVPQAGLGLDQGGINIPRGQHGRRHSVNVLNKTPTATTFNAPFNQSNFGGEAFDDSYAQSSSVPGNGHARTMSRAAADSSWRINGGVGAAVQNPGFSAELAQAQAQLQSLQQFRAASGGHHQKLPSFSFPNMLPNMMAANMMGLGNYNLMQQQQQFQMQLQQQSNGPQRKSLFAPYLPQASLPPLLAAGKLVVGILRVNKRNRSDAYVATEVLDADIYICGSKDRNRALEGDIVAVELLDVDEVWGTKKEKEEKKRKKEENSAYDVKALAGRKNDKKKDDVEVEGQGLTLFEDEEVTDEIKPQFAGHVVAVVERMPGQLFSGTLGLLRPSSAATKEKQEAERREREGDRSPEDNRNKAPTERPKIVWFKPTDKRVPLIAIPTEQAPPDFVQNSDAYVDRLFVACIKRHPISSLHPFGTLVEELGPIGEVEVETSALLKDCNFPTEEFPDNAMKCLPPLPWIIPEREFETRKDLRGDRIFTIDPKDARDLDDALSIKANDDGTFSVGVHIADVSFFVKPNTALDRDARKRATSVYLVQRAVPMLPPTLCEQLCSLVPGEDRLAFSIIFTLTKDGRVLDKWFGRTIVNSSAKFSYEDAQAAIDGQTVDASKIRGQHDAASMAQDVKALWSIAREMYARRTAEGFLHSSQERLKFTLDANGSPSDCGPYQLLDANHLIEEFMLLTNITVAQQLAVNLPEQALLRRHEEPLERRVKQFAERASRMGYEIDVSTAGTIQKSLEAIADPEARLLLELLARKANRTAKYYCSGMLDIAKYSHYALNASLYTHFTSPIRRYADILAHRQLESILAGASATEPKFSMDRDSVAKIAQQCNIKRESAKLAQEQSAHLFLGLLLSDLTTRYGPVVRQARVINVLDAAFDVVVPEFGIEKRVHVDQMPIDNHVYDEHTHSLQIYWSNKDVITWLAENADDEHLKKVKRAADHHAVKMEVASASVHDERALFDDDDNEEDEIVLNRSKDQPAAETSKQRIISAQKTEPVFEGLRTTAAGHKIQEIKELMSVPVIVTADLTKSPPVLKVYSVNPYAEKKVVAPSA